MRHRPAVVAFVSLLLLLVSSPLLAQSRNTGAIRGTVTDENGGRIPGVLVEIESPDMIGGRKAVTTDGNGTYRFPELVPGTYQLSFSIEGYQSVRREGIVVQAAKSFDVDIQLTPRAGEETIVVSGQTPLVDVTSSGTTTNFNEAYLQNLPTGRFQPDTLNLAPGIENSAAYGGGGSSANSYSIDGVDVSDPEGGTPWSFFNYNVMKEVQLIGLGAPAEYGGFTGVLFNSVTKSGSNDFSGMAEAYYFPSSLVPRNTQDPGLQPPTIEKSYDSTFQVGGPFIKDKLWYFVNAQYFNDESSNGGPIRTETSPRLFGKLTWQINPDNVFEFWGEWDRYDIKGRGGDAFTPLEATVKEDAPEWVWNFSWRSVLSPSTSINVAYTGYTGYYYLDPTSGYDRSGHINAQTGLASGNSTFFYLADRSRNILNASVSHFSDKFLTGKHDFKYGVELERSRTRSRAGIPGTAYYYDDYYYDADPYDGTPGKYYDYAYVGYYTYDQKAINTRATAFVQDSWQITDRWTVNPGLRLDLNRGSVPGKGNAYRTNPLALRLGFAYDLTGKKKTVLKAHYGRYYEALFSSYYQLLSPKAASDQFYYQLDDTVPGFMFDPDTVDPNNPPPGVTLISSQPQQRYELDKDIKHPYVDQYLIAIEHDLGHDFALKAEFIYRKNKDFIETISKDGDFDKVVGLDGEGNPIKLFNQNNLDDTLLITNPPDLKREYAGVILTATKRFSNRWQMLASYARTHATGNIDNVDVSFSELIGQNYGPSPFLDTPNSTVNWQGTLTNDFKDEVTLQGQYIIPKIEVTVSGDYRYVSGQTFTPVDRSTSFLSDPNDLGSPTIGFNQGRVRFFSEPRGSRRLDPTNNLNFRAEKFFSFEGGTRLGVFADIFNVFNTGEDTEVNANVSSTFGDAVAFSPPRTVRLGLRYNW